MANKFLNYTVTISFAPYMIYICILYIYLGKINKYINIIILIQKLNKAPHIYNIKLMLYN